MKNKELLKQLRKFGKGFLIFALILGILSSTFGVCVMAFTGNGGGDSDGDKGGNGDNNDNPTATETYVPPTEQYTEINNEMQLNDSVVVFTEEESKAFNNSVRSIEARENYGRQQLEIVLDGTNDKVDSSYGDIVYIQGNQNTPFGEDRILKFDSVYTSGGQTHIKASEPYFEDVFTSLGICASDPLTAENFVEGYYAEGVRADFGTINDDGTMVLENTQSSPSVQPMSATVQPMASQHSTDKHDLIVEIDYQFKNNDKNSKKEEDEYVKKSFGIKGKFGIRDLTAHMVCDMPSVTNIKELYFGVSGEKFVDIDVYGQISASAEMEASKKDTWLFTLEGLNEKRFPIAIFHFKGTTPVYITSKAFDKTKKSLVPSLFIMLYSDWEGKISLELNAGFDYAHSFNNGIRIFKDGKPCLSFEKYPYTAAYDATSEDGFKWDFDLTLDANTDVTIFGASLLFYVAGVNMAELSATRIGIEAKCEISVKGDSKNGMQWPDITNTDFYIRGYWKFLEVKVKLKADGKSFLKNLSIDVDFEFGLLDFTFFEKGNRPDKYQKVPISSMQVPDKFASVISLVFDVSGSMNDRVETGESKLEAAKNAAKIIVSTTETWAENNKGNYGIGVVQFASSAKTVAVPHIDYKFLNDCIDTMYDGGGTSIYQGIDLGILQLEAVTSDKKVMILMTDGQDYNTASAKASAQKAADAGIKIYTIGFGQGVNEDILKEIASITGGEYKFANTENVISIAGSFMYAQQSTNADVIGEIEGAVSEGEISPPTTFDVANGSGNLLVSNAWPGSFLDTILIDPNGRVVDENYPNSITDESKIPSTIIVTNPVAGKWTVRIKGVECSYEKEPFYTIISFDKTERVKVNDEMSDLQKAAVYCTAIGLFVTLASAMLLVCLREKNSFANVPHQNYDNFN